MRLRPIAACLAAATLPLFAPDASAGERSYLLIDASGSMWGQIDGVAKIQILRDNMRRVVADLKGSSEVGVIAFGHREKGACGDIEEVSPLRPFDGAEIADVIDRISPKGKTPLADGLIMAVEKLKYTEERAKVVILGDGKESCGKNPCAVAEKLEEFGVDLTVDAIALDIADEEGVRQLQCIAAKTGGEFIAVTDTVQFTEAIKKVAVAVAPEAAPAIVPAAAPEPKGVRLVVTGVQGDAEWTLIDKATEDVTIVTAASGELRTDIPPGDYEVFVSAGDGFGEAEARVVEGELVEIIVAIGEAAPAPLAISRDAAPAGSPLEATWTIEPAPKDIVFIAPVGDPDNRYPLDRRAFHQVRASRSGALVAPAAPGRYEVRYFRFDSGGVLHRAALLVTAPEVAIDGPDRIGAGQIATAKVTGPLAPGDFVFIAPASWRANQYPVSASDRAPAGGDVRLRAPSSSGAHEIRYFSQANGVALFSKPLEVVLDAARVEPAAGEAPAGAVVTVDFAGPRRDKDVLFITGAETDRNRYNNGNGDRAAAAGAAPARLVAPAKEGVYEIRYFSPDHGGLLAKARLVVGPPVVTLDAPRVVQRGETVSIAAQGPGAPGDVVFIAETAWGDRQYPSAAGQRRNISGDGAQTVDLRAPGRPGTYQIRYFSWANGDVLARRSLIVR